MDLTICAGDELNAISRVALQVPGNYVERSDGGDRDADGDVRSPVDCKCIKCHWPNIWTEIGQSDSTHWNSKLNLIKNGKYYLLDRILHLRHVRDPQFHLFVSSGTT